MNKPKILTTLITILFIFNSCNELIEYSPFDTNVSSTKINIKNLQIIKDSIDYYATEKDTLAFAVITDSHDYYDDLKEAIWSINGKDGLQFIICCGDITARGISQEYIWYREITKDFKYPLFTVIGNHDHRSNGKIIFERMFGPLNMSFIYGGYKFILFDDVVWENNNKAPDFEWLEAELEKDELPVILITHIPPWGDQLIDVYDDRFRQIIVESNIILSLHGHHHSPCEEIFAQVSAVITGSVEENVYRIVKLTANHHEVETIILK